MAIYSRADVPYAAMADKLISKTAAQKIIPFLGAGVSASGRQDEAPAEPPVAYPSMEAIEPLINGFELTGVARVFLTAAILLSFHIQSRQDKLDGVGADDLFERLVRAKYPPSTSDLTLLLSRYAGYTSLKEVVPRILRSVSPIVLEQQLLDALMAVCTVTGIASPPDSLSTIAAYYEQQLGRDDLWGKLQEIFTTKKDPTLTHRMLAEAANEFVRKVTPMPAESFPVRSQRHYLILTTNYDQLMESALDALEPKIPYVVLSNKLDVKSNPQNPAFLTTARFSPNVDGDAAVKHSPAPCGDFRLHPDVPSMVIIHKIHGCLAKNVSFDDEGVIISDNDYVNFISQREVLPVDVKNLIQARPLLFLGYSLNDANVRSIFESIKRQRSIKSASGDFCVNRQLKTFDRVFFDKNNVHVFQTDLNEFSQGVLDEYAKRPRKD